LHITLTPSSNPLSITIKNSTEFVEKLKNITLNPDERLYSYNAEALFPSIPIKICLDVIERKLCDDASLSSRTKLSPKDIHELLDLCLSSTNFTYNGHHHTTKDSGPIGLSLMVSIAQIWMIHTMETAIVIANQRNIQTPKHMCIYMDDCFGTL
jgi:hypothetical protein